MTQRDWDSDYAEGALPWDTGEPDPELTARVDAGVVSPGRAFEVGCGTGTNAVWLAQRGFDVVAVDVSPRAIDRARAKANEAGVEVRFSVRDFLAEEPDGGPFDFVVDRGVLHTFDEAPERALFAHNVARLLADGGQWLTLAGSTEGPPRDHGPPRRTARDLMNAIEPELEIVELRSFEFHADLPGAARAWALRARKRDVPAVAPTRT